MFKVLVCVDRSDLSMKAFKWYMKNFHKPENKLIVCHVSEYWGDMQRMMSPARIQECVDETNKHSKELEEACAAACREFGSEVDFEVLSGKEAAWHEICSYAQQIGANAIVIGTRGMGKLKRSLLGSVSDGVLHHCHTPVLIYKE